MNNDERELFMRSIEAAMGSGSVDVALDQLGWVDALREDPQTAITVLFESQGRACATSCALELVLGDLDVYARVVAGGIDPGVRVVEVVGDAPAGAVRLARLALSHELIGTARAMLELARTHALERIQFGVPIASFQAVRHRLAETLVAIETAQAAVDAAWLDDAPHHAAIAKAVAGRSARTTARHSQQVLAGIGFTMEHPFHRYFRRALVLDEQFGSARVLTKELGEQILATGVLPTAVRL